MAGGGTGGHLFPALALAEELRTRVSGIEITFAGAERGLEARVVPEYGYELKLFDIEGVKKRSIGAKLRAILKASVATIKAVSFLRELRPDGVIGSGGYSSGPVLLAARLLGIKTAILEQNAVPGLTNRLLGKIVDRVYIAFKEAENFFPSAKVLRSGNPVRREIISSSKAATRARGMRASLSILVFGGSQGATVINTAFLDATEYLTDIWPLLSVTHQSGKEGYKVTKDSYERKGLKVKVLEFIDDMAGAYAEADLVICRAGATTIAEITALGLPAVLVPYPFAADNHQEVNARTLEKGGAALMLRQDEITGATLADIIKKFFSDRAELRRFSEVLKSFGRPEAGKVIVDDFLGLMKGSKKNV
jgi:UDP-N-acetylglucosamine--N-acetylmuramyl-(pentapeptide) pyrophosphoryl-undecaprenol N-acetylglucosamine transferase